MEATPFAVLRDGMLQVKLMSFSNTEKCEVVQRYLFESQEISACLEPVVEAIASSGIIMDEVIENFLIEIGNSINEVRRFFDGWDCPKSKLHSVLEIEPLLTKTQESILQACRLLRPLFQSPEILSFYEFIQQCVDKLEPKCYLEISDMINMVIVDQVKNVAPRCNYLGIIAKSIGLLSNLELLMELASLKMLKSKMTDGKDHRDVTRIDHLIALVDYMQSWYARTHQVENINDVQIPIDFCCPLSLRVMSDPVIVASGQTYERAYIKQWLDQGFTLCPRTWQNLGHTNMIPNYTVKALIASWCETYVINLSEPSNLALNCSRECRMCERYGTDHYNAQNFPSDESVQSPAQSNGPTLNSRQGKPENSSSNHFPHEVRYKIWRVDDYHGERPIQAVTQDASLSITVPNGAFRRGEGDPASSSNSAKGEAEQLEGDAFLAHIYSPLNLGVTQQKSKKIGKLHASTSRSVPEFTSSEEKSILSEIDNKVNQLISDLQSSSIDAQSAATLELRLLTRDNIDNRFVVVECGGVDHLIGLLRSSDLAVQENAVTALLNLSLNSNNRTTIANADPFDSLIHVLKTGSQEAQANAAACLYSLSAVNGIQARIGQSEAIGPLVELLRCGTPQAQKDAVMALFNLSLLHENKVRIVHAGAVDALLILMDPAIGVVDKAVAVMANLSSIAEGRDAIGRGGGIPALIEIIELGSSRGKENAAAALLHLCMDSNHGTKFCNMALQADAVPPVKVLANTGTPRAKEKARTLLSYFRNQRQRRAPRR